MFECTNPDGIPFRVRVVRSGETYGLNDMLTHQDADPLVEFYDARYDFSPGRGQFVSRYSMSTLRSRNYLRLQLEGGVRDWWVSAQNLSDFFASLGA